MDINKNNENESTKIEHIKEVQVGKRKAHPLGEKVKVKVFSLSSTDKKSQIFASINQYTIEIQQNQEVEIRKTFVDFLKTATRITHVLDDKGNAMSKNEPLYAVTTL